MKEKFKKLLSAVSALAVTIAVLPITELPAIAEDEMVDVANEPTDFSLVEDDSATEEVISDSDIMVSTFDTPMIMAAQTGITKEEWIHDLVTVFDMSIEDDSTMEYYFKDVDSSTYAYEINLAANYGVFDIESDLFNPNDYVTREFAAHTANFCIGYLDDGTTVTFSDSDAIYYEYDAIVAVQRGWFTVQGGKFVPNGNMNDSERQKILEDARACQENTSINVDNDNTVKYTNSVIQFEATSNAAYFNGVVTIANTKTSLKKGDVFLVNVDGADCLYTANAITKDEDGNLIVDVETAKTEAAVEYIDIEGYGEVDYNNIVFYDTASTVADVAKLSLDNGMLYLPRSTAILASATKDSITLNKKLEDDGITFSLTGAITNIQPEYKLKLNPLSGGIESFYLNASADASITASMKGEFKNTKSRDIKIASVPVICAGIFNVNMIVSVTVSVSGETTLSYSWEMDGGISYTKADGWRTTKNFQKKGFSLEAKVSESVAVKAALVATLGKEKMGEAYLMGGEKGTISGKQQKDGVGCVTLNAYVFAEYGASFNLLGIKTFSDSTQFINAQNSPVKINLHWEDGKLVDKCSYGDNITGSSTKPTKSLTYLGSYSSYGTEYSGLISSTDDYTPYQTWTENKTLSGNVTVDGDLYLKSDVNLNGYTLTVNGDLIQTKGEIHIGGGTLNVNGSYTVSDTGVLCMLNEDDAVNVGKDFTIKNNISYYSVCSEAVGNKRYRFSYGVLSIGGNFYQYNGKTETENFKSTNEHVVKFVGSGVHEIYLESPYSYIGELSVPDDAKVKFTGYFTGFRANQDLTVAGDLTLYSGSTLNLNGSTLNIEGNFTQNGTIDLYCGVLNINGDYKSDGYIKNTGYQESVVNVNKNMSLTGGTTNLNSITMNVNGDLTQANGEIHIGGGTLNVNGSYTVSDTGILCMLNEDDAVNVGKDFTIKNNISYYSVCSEAVGNKRYHFSYGVLSIGGNFYQYNGKTETENFKSTNEHVVKFVGSGIHEIYLESPYSYIGELSVPNNEKVKFTGYFTGIRANQDLTVVGDLTLYKDSTLDLNGSTLTIEGNFAQDGTIDLNCGTLNINGDYKSDGYIKNTGYQESVVNVNKNMSLTGGTTNLNSITMNVNGDLAQTNGEIHIGGGTLNVNGSYTVSDTGILCMLNEDDAVNVGKDFTIKNNISYYSVCSEAVGNKRYHFSYGVLSIGGNFYQYNGKTETANFKSTDKHIVKFVGSDVHKINSESSDTSMHDIILTDGASISFNGSFGGFSTVSSCTFSSSKPTVAKITGNTVQSVSVGYATLKIDDKVSIDLTVEEVVTGDANGDGKLTVADAVILQKWLLAVPNVRLANWEACDLCKDGRIDVFDLCLLKRKLINS